MPWPFRVIAVLFISLSISDARVDFTFSTLYNIYDFEGMEEIPLPRCNSGCFIYASTMPNYQPSEDGKETYMKNLVIYDPANSRNESIADLGMNLKQGGWQKMPLEITIPGSYSILNLNALADKGTDVTVWVIDHSKASEIDYEIYDAATMNRSVSAPASVVTIMSAMQFRVMAEPGEANSYTARLVGFDNALDENIDKCIYAYKTQPPSTFEGFEFQINAPMVSIVFDKKTSVNLKADFNYLNVRDLSKSGFLSSPGFNGCDRLGGNQVHRSKLYHYSDEYDFHGAPVDYQVFFNGYLDFSPGHEIVIKDMTNSQSFPISGTRATFERNIPRTQYINVYYNDISIPQTFMLRYTSTLRNSSPESKTSTTTAETSPHTSSTITSNTQTPTTSTVGEVSTSVAISLIVFVLPAL